MKGRQKGRPTKWVSASVGESISVGKPGVTFEVWGKVEEEAAKAWHSDGQCGWPPLVAAQGTKLP